MGDEHKTDKSIKISLIRLIVFCAQHYPTNSQDNINTAIQEPVLNIAQNESMLPHKNWNWI